MKRIFAGFAALSLLVLAGCGNGSGGPEDSLPLTEVRSSQLDEDLTLTTEWPAYASLDSTVYVLLENHSDKTVDTGAYFSLEVDFGGGGEFSWHQLDLKENVGCTAIAYEIAPGGSMAFACNLSAYETSFLTGGHFRIVKEVSGQKCVAEFTVSDDAPISAEKPYGFLSLEELPADYGAASASENEVVYTEDGAMGETAVAFFLHKVSLEIPCQLRVVQDDGKNIPIVTDVIYKNRHFLWRTRSGGEVSEQRYSYIVTDGEDLYLANGADWENTLSHQSGKTLLVPERMAQSDWLSLVEEMTAVRLQDNGDRFRIWSADGEWNAALYEMPTEFGVSWQKPGKGGWGRIYNLNRWDGLESAILELEWREDGALLLICETVTGEPSCLIFDPETGQMTSGDLRICS